MVCIFSDAAGVVHSKGFKPATINMFKWLKNAMQKELMYNHKESTDNRDFSTKINKLLFKKERNRNSGIEE